MDLFLIVVSLMLLMYFAYRGYSIILIAAFISRSLGKEHAIRAVLLGCGVLTYGGLSVFVMYLFTALLFREANLI